MWLVGLTLAGALGLSAGAMVAVRFAYGTAPLGWRILAHAGWPLSLAGAVFVLRFWVPTVGPYRANVRYPFGTHVNAWAVSFGFTWIAFGLLFTVLAVLASRHEHDRAASSVRFDDERVIPQGRSECRDLLYRAWASPKRSESCSRHSLAALAPAG